LGIAVGPAICPGIAKLCPGITGVLFGRITFESDIITLAMQAGIDDNAWL